MPTYSEPKVFTFPPLGSPIDDAPGDLLDDAFTDYERQEITRHHRNARRAIADLVHTLWAIDDDLARGDVPHRVLFGQKPEQIAEAIASLREVSNGAHHRIAVEERDAEAVEKIRAYLVAVDRMGSNVDHERLHTIGYIDPETDEDVEVTLHASTLRQLAR